MSLIFLSVVPFLLPLLLVLKLFPENSNVTASLASWSVVPPVLILIFRIRSDRFNLQKRGYAWTHPLGALFLAGVMLKSALTRSGVEWKGRSYGHLQSADNGWSEK